MVTPVFDVPSTAPGRNDEDELYETYICETNAIYRLAEDELVLAEEFSGRPLRHGMLRSKEVSPLSSEECVLHAWRHFCASVLNTERQSKLPHCGTDCLEFPTTSFACLQQFTNTGMLRIYLFKAAYN